MKNMFSRTRKAFSINLKSQETLKEMKVKKSKNLENMQILAKRERYEIWNQNDMAKLYLIEILSLKNRFEKYGIGKNKGISVKDNHMKVIKTG